MVAALVPPTAPIAVLGLGAGTVAHIIHTLFPETPMVGWELDMGVVLTAQMFLGLTTLEQSGKMVWAYMGIWVWVSKGVWCM